MTGSETTIVRCDGDGKPLAVDIETGMVDRRLRYYPVALRSDCARGLFLDLVGIVFSHEVQRFIVACNRAATLRQSLSVDERRDAALRFAKIVPTCDAKPSAHSLSCRCPRCLVSHAQRGCRKVGCPTCFG